MKQLPLTRRKSTRHCHWNTTWLLRKQTFLIVISFMFTSLQLLAQVKTVTGTVHDDKGQPVSGASIMLKGTTKGSTTDAAGSFSIQAPDNATLTVSFVGFATQEIDVKGRSSVDVKLGAVNQSLNEVVVIGYGQQKKQDLTGSVAVLSGNSLKDQPVTNVDQKLTGQVAGVQVNQTTGTPGGGSSIQIRGQATFGLTTEPLFVVDGYPLPSS